MKDIELRPEVWLKARRKVLGLTLALAGLLAIWALSAILIAKPFLPSPEKAFRALATMGNSGLLWIHGSASAGRFGEKAPSVEGEAVRPVDEIETTSRSSGVRPAAMLVVPRR